MKAHENRFKLLAGNFSIEKQHYANIGLDERLLSMFLGGVLMGRGLKKPHKLPFLAGIYLAYRGSTGKCAIYEKLGIDSRHPKAINIRGEFDIDKPAAEVYAYWRNLENLPGSLKHLLDVKVIDNKLSHWKSNILGNMFPIDWNAQIVKDEPGRLIGWRSLPGSSIHHVGRVTFTETADGLGTKLHIILSYHPPIGGIGAGIAKLLNPVFENLLVKEIKSFKHNIEEAVPF
ncbi:SRPBCC family protein [Pedobacter faecalis]|uniref:SRPBCC family protein n=1 Tax=Pedobacter faecalis TaxID=3041495 RepID=UPI0025518C29|nr:SRPBCC family protein [Pedobacter sp. ELA7]